MKKIGFAFIAILGLGVLYYVIFGSKQILKEVQTQVHKELHIAQNNGFKITDQTQTKKSDHFILTFDDPEKVAPFLQSKGISFSPEDARDFKGLSLEMQVNYLVDSYSAVSMDIYPLHLPDALMQAAQTEEKKDFLTHIAKLLQEKKILVHVDINKLGTAFKGYTKDFSEQFTRNKERTTVTLKGLTFSGTLDNRKLHSLTQNVSLAKVDIAKNIHLTFKDLKSDYTRTGKTVYDYTSQYAIDNITLTIPENNTKVVIDNTSINSRSMIENKLASGSMHAQSHKVLVQSRHKTTSLENVNIDTNVSNLNISAFDKLQGKTLNEAERTALFQQLISKGVVLNIVDISAQNIIDNNQTLDAMHLSAHLDIDPSLNIKASSRNPLAALEAIDANLKLTLSPALLGYIAKQPQAMLAIMMFQPQDVKGQKVYSIELKDGKGTLNGKPMF